MHRAPVLTRANCRGTLHIHVRIHLHTFSKIATIIRTSTVNVKPRVVKVLKHKVQFINAFHFFLYPKLWQDSTWLQAQTVCAFIIRGLRLLGRAQSLFTHPDVMFCRVTPSAQIYSLCASKESASWKRSILIDLAVQTLLVLLAVV